MEKCTNNTDYCNTLTAQFFLFNIKPVFLLISVVFMNFTNHISLMDLQNKNFSSEFWNKKADDITQGTRENFGSWGAKNLYIFRQCIKETTIIVNTLHHPKCSYITSSLYKAPVFNFKHSHPTQKTEKKKKNWYLSSNMLHCSSPSLPNPTFFIPFSPQFIYLDRENPLHHLIKTRSRNFGRKRKTHPV